MIRYDEVRQMKQIDLKCPLLKHDCIGNKCMWWIDKGSMTRKCAIARLAIRT